MTSPYVAQIALFAFTNILPRNWLPCNGQLQSIQQNQAMFALIGTAFGGNGVNNFQLPDLQGRMAIGWGNGNGLTPRVLGEKAGTENAQVLLSQLPLHNHSLSANTGAPNAISPTVNLLSSGPVTGSSNTNIYSTTAGSTMNAAALQATGNGTAFSIVQPLLAMNYCICVFGIFPSRN